MLSMTQQIQQDRALAFTWTDLIPDSRFPLFEDTMVHLFTLLDELRPIRILETGSGLTSALLRKYCPHSEVHSVETHTQWMHHTRMIFKRFDLQPTHLYMWDDLLRDPNPPSFDFIIHDMGDTQTRIKTLGPVLLYATPQCHVLLDNFGTPPYKEHAYHVMTRKGFKPLFPKNPLTLNAGNAGGFATFVRE